MSSGLCRYPPLILLHRDAKHCTSTDSHGRHGCICYNTYVHQYIYEPAHMVDPDAYEIDFDTPNLANGYTKVGDRSRSHNNLYVKSRPANRLPGS